jgi:chromosome transmission fidelity protein 8
MLIPITFNPDSKPQTPKLPPTLAKISNDEVVLIELQGNLEVSQSSDKNGQFVGELTIDETGSVSYE